MSAIQTRKTGTKDICTITEENIAITMNYNGLLNQCFECFKKHTMVLVYKILKWDTRAKVLEVTTGGCMYYDSNIKALYIVVDLWCKSV